jgi:hypothetical protein
MVFSARPAIFGLDWIAYDAPSACTHHAHRVRHHVMQFAGDASALLADGDAGGLITFGFQQMQPGLHFELVGPARADEFPEHPAKRHPAGHEGHRDHRVHLDHKRPLTSTSTATKMAARRRPA